MEIRTVSKIKWISQEVDSRKVQDLLNLYSNYIIAESLQIAHSAKNTVVVTFMLDQTFDNLEDLNEALNEEPLF